MQKGEKYKGVDIGAWKYDGPKDFVKKLMDKFGPPTYVEKNPDTCEAESVTFKNIDGFDIVRIVDSNTNKLHPYPAKIYVEGGLYFNVPNNMVGKLKEASPTIMIDELNGLVIGKCASLTIAAATVQFVIDAVNGNTPPTRAEYDKRLKKIIDNDKVDPKIPWWENKLNEEITKTDIIEACWQGYRQAGMKKKGKRMVPNCVPEEVDESLKDWFGKGPKGDWVRLDTKGNIKGDCARDPGEGKPKCVPRSKAHSMSKKDRASAARRKRAKDPQVDRPGTGNKPINVRTESVEYIEEKSKPNNPKLWSKAKSLARSKFDVYPSAYANGWAAKWYKSKGGTWRSASESALVNFSDFIAEDDMKGMSVSSGHKRSVKSGAGMTQKGVAAYRRRNPGSKLKTAVTTPPSKLKKGSKAAKRRIAFCARSRSWTGPRGKAARRRWNC